MLADRFTQMFREEHRQVRDTLLALVPAFRAHDGARAMALLLQCAALTGPHFRYEEEALYPGLVEFFGQEYVEKLMVEHDNAIGAAKKLVELASKPQITDDDSARAIRLIQGILPHVSDCDGLSIMVERQSDEQVQAVFDARDRSLAEGLNLLEWEAGVRGRPAAKVA